MFLSNEFDFKRSSLQSCCQHARHFPSRHLIEHETCWTVEHCWCFLKFNDLVELVQNLEITFIVKSAHRFEKILESFSVLPVLLSENNLLSECTFLINLRTRFWDLFWDHLGLFQFTPNSWKTKNNFISTSFRTVYPLCAFISKIPAIQLIISALGT